MRYGQERVRRRVSCCQGCCGIRGCRVRRVAARVETRERSSDPLARYRPLTHASAGDPSGAARNMPSQLFDSTHNLCPLCPSPPALSLSFARSTFFLFLFSTRACLPLPSPLSRFFPRLSDASLYPRAEAPCSFFLPTHVSLYSVRRLSFTFSFHRTSRSSRFISSTVVVSVSPKFRADVRAWRRPALN